MPVHMAEWLPPVRYWVLAIFIASALYAHFRGRVRFKLARALTDFTVLLAPINAAMYLFSRPPATPYLKTEDFKELDLLRDNWQLIRDEALRLNDEGYIKAASGYNDIGFNSFFRTGWKRFYLKWYGDDLPSAQQMCPKTVALLRQIPGVKAAMFASLPIYVVFFVTIAFTVMLPEVVLYLPKLLLPESVGCFKNPSGVGYICPN